MTPESELLVAVPNARSGVTRTVVITPRWVVKVAWGRVGLLRGWLANRSEWVQRYRDDVNRPLATFLHLLLVFRRADAVGGWDTDDSPMPSSYSNEESKGSSWGRFGETWLLIDYDRAWAHPRGLVGGAYYWRQERQARRWIAGEDSP